MRSPSPLVHVATMRRLVADLATIAEGRSLTAHDLEEAVIMGNLRHSQRTAPCLEGFTAGHPRYGNQMIRPSQVFAIDPEFPWARTLSRFYRLEGYLRYRGGEH